MENNNKENISIKSVVVKYLHHWKLFLAVFILSFIPAIAYLTLMPRTYQFKGGVLLQDDEKSSISGLPMGEVTGLMKSFGLSSIEGSVAVDDEMQVLSSNRMMRLMINKLGINFIYSKPYSFYNYYNTAPLKLSADSTVLASLDSEYRFTVSVKPDNIKVKVKIIPDGESMTFNYKSLPAVIDADGAIFRLDYNGINSSDKNFKLKIKCMPASWVAEKLSKNLLIENFSKSSKVLEISYTDHVKERGKDVINTLVSEYNKDVVEYDNMQSVSSLRFVESRISNIITELGDLELSIQDFKKKNNVTLLENDVTMYGELIRDIEGLIIENESQSRLIDMLDEYIRDPEHKYSVIPSFITANEGEKGGAMKLYNEALMERERLLKSSNSENELFIIVNDKVEKLREGVYSMIENTKKGANKTLAELKTKENQLFAQLKTVPEKEREYVAYRRTQEILQGLYLMLLQKKEEEIMSLGNKVERARLIEPAYVEKKPVGPRKLFAAIGMILITLVAPIIWLLMKDLVISLKDEYKRTK